MLSSFARRIWRQPQKIELLCLDSYGYIKSFESDSFFPQLQQFNIDSEWLSLIPDIIQAGLVYSLSQKIFLKPGLFKKGDESIKEYLYTRVSLKIPENQRNEIVDRLCQSWNRVANHAFTLSFQKILQRGEKNPLSEFEYFFVFAEHFFKGLLCLDFEVSNEVATFYGYLSELFFANIEGRPLSLNLFYNLSQLTNRIDVALQEVDESCSQKLTKLKSEINKIEESIKAQLYQIGGTVDLGLMNVDPEERTFWEEGLRHVLEGDGLTTGSPKITSELVELYKYYTQQDLPVSKCGEFLFKNEREKPKKVALKELVHEGIEYLVKDFAKENKLCLYRDDFPMPDSLKFIDHMKEHEIVRQLMEKSIADPYRIYVLYQSTQSLLIREIILGLLKNEDYNQWSHVLFNTLKHRSTLGGTILLSGALLPFLRNKQLLAFRLDPQSKPFVPAYEGVKKAIGGPQFVLSLKGKENEGENDVPTKSEVALSRAFESLLKLKQKPL